MDVSIFMNMGVSWISLKDACIVELVLSPREDGKGKRCIGGDSNDMIAETLSVKEKEILRTKGKNKMMTTTCM